MKNLIMLINSFKKEMKDSTLVPFDELYSLVTYGFLVGLILLVLISGGYLFGDANKVIDSVLSTKKYELGFGILVVAGLLSVSMHLVEFKMDKKIGLTGIFTDFYRKSYGVAFSAMISFFPLAVFSHITISKIILMYFFLLIMCKFVFDMIYAEKRAFRVKLIFLFIGITLLLICKLIVDKSSEIPFNVYLSGFILFCVSFVITVSLWKTSKIYLLESDAEAERSVN